MIIHFYFYFYFFFGGGLCVQPQAVVCLSGVQFQEYMEDLGVSVFSIQSETFASTTPTSATLRQAKSKLETWLARYVFFFLFFIFQVCKTLHAGMRLRVAARSTTLSKSSRLACKLARGQLFSPRPRPPCPVL